MGYILPDRALAQDLPCEPQGGGLPETGGTPTLAGLGLLLVAGGAGMLIVVATLRRRELARHNLGE